MVFLMSSVSGDWSVCSDSRVCGVSGVCSDSIVSLVTGVYTPTSGDSSVSGVCFCLGCLRCRECLVTCVCSASMWLCLLCPQCLQCLECLYSVHNLGLGLAAVCGPRPPCSPALSCQNRATKQACMGERGVCGPHNTHIHITGGPQGSTRRPDYLNLKGRVTCNKPKKNFPLITFLGGWGTGTMFCKFFLHCITEKRERLFAPLAPPTSRLLVAVKDLT